MEIDAENQTISYKFLETSVDILSKEKSISSRNV